MSFKFFCQNFLYSRQIILQVPVETHSNEDTEQDNAPSPDIKDEQPTQIIFRVAIEKGALAAAPPRGSAYFEWSIVTDPVEIDGAEEYGSEDSNMQNSGTKNPESMEDEELETAPILRNIGRSCILISTKLHRNVQCNVLKSCY
jgi:hypothetical protein